MAKRIGAFIDSGASDWQIFQQDERGKGSISLEGRSVVPRLGQKALRVEVRLTSQETGCPVGAHLDWQVASLRPNGVWRACLQDIPAGGLYQIETRLVIQARGYQDTLRGDMRRFLGVGDLWVIAGQSNASGYGQGPVHDPPEMGIHLLNNAMQWSLAAHPLNDSTNSAHLANYDQRNTGHAPWLHWARRIKQVMGYPIGLLQTSLGGVPLSTYNPTEKGDHALYELMLQTAKSAGGKVRGVLWYQGCSDTNGEAARTYQGRFIAAVRAWRKALGDLHLPVLTVQINRVCLPDWDPLGWSLVREAQRQVPHELEGVTVTPAIDLPLSDIIHNSASGNLLLAERVADAALGSVYGKDVAYRAPDISAARASRDRRSIELRFDNVTFGWVATDSTAIPFQVEDQAGSVPIAKVEFPGRSICLKLERELQGRAVVHGAPGLNPPPVPHDEGTRLPMLAFYGMSVK